MSACRDCGHWHTTAGDRLACEAIQGRVRAWPEGVRDPETACALCGYCSSFSELLEHFRHEHRGDQPATGRLVRPMLTFPASEWL